MFNWFKRKPKPQRYTRIVADVGTGSRQYHAAKSSRLTSGWASNNDSSDSQLASSIVNLRGRSRALIRDTSYAKRARVLVVNNVIGNGIGLQAQVKTQRGQPMARVNTDIEAAWKEWSKAENCHTGGRLHFKMMERQIMAQVFEAGDVFIRIHNTSFGQSRIPFTLELIEAERMAEEYAAPFIRIEAGHELRMGVEIDKFQRPVAYHIRQRHPGEIRFDGNAWDGVERVPADQIIHVAVIDRWPQTRGEPWLHAAARRLNDMDGYSEAEIIRARTQALTTSVIETPQATTSLGTEVEEDGSVSMELEAGVLKRLNPGERIGHGEATSPNPSLDPFMRYMLREIASGVGVSYESLSRDYSQSNYSSSRLALLDDRDLWRYLQQWFILDFRQKVHERWLQQAILAGAIPSISVGEYAINPGRFAEARFKPRGWTWVDPTKEVQAYQEAVKSSFTTVEDVIAQTGGGMDLEEVLEQRAKELEMMKSKGLVFETSPEFYNKQPKATSPPTAQGEPPMRVVKRSHE